MIIKDIHPNDLFDNINYMHVIDGYINESRINSIETTEPSKEHYYALVNSGSFNMVGVFDGDNIVGFGTLVTSIIPKHGILASTVDSIFLLDEYRDTGYGIKILDRLKDISNDRGSVVMLISSPVGSKLDKLLSLKKNTELVSNVYACKL
jgi:hypothetical protein